eukprot:1138248-Pelagomonas_calceolata.AAC.9
MANKGRMHTVAHRLALSRFACRAGPVEGQVQVSWSMGEMRNLGRVRTLINVANIRQTYEGHSASIPILN